LGGFSGTLDSDTTVRLLERGSVVDTVTSHGSQVTTLLQHLDDLVLVLGENFSETIGRLGKIVLSSTRETTVDETIRVVDLGTKSKHLASFLSNSDGVTSKHLDLKTKNLSLSNGLSGILTRRVEHGQHAEELPFVVTFLDSNTESTETTTSELGSFVTVEVGGFLGAVGQSENGLGGTLGSNVANTVLLELGGDTLGDGVEGSVLDSLPAFLENVAGFGVTLEGENGDFVNGIERLDIVGRSESGNGHHPVDIDAFSGVWLTDGKLVGSQSTGLVRAENVDTSK
jgi:hypothetical protein